MAGFMHTQQRDASKHLEVCPVFVGPALIFGHAGFCAMFLIFFFTEIDIMEVQLEGGLVLGALMLPCLTTLAYVVLLHCHSIEVMQQQVRCFTIERSFSQCCVDKHLDSNGQRILCDRDVILRCISAWFGSPEQFEDMVRTKLLRQLVYQLANHTFSYWRILQAMSPVMWFKLDWFLPGEFMRGVVETGVYWLVLGPTMVRVSLRLTYSTRKLSDRTVGRALISMCLVANAMLMFGAFFVLEQVLPMAFGDRLASTSVLLVTLLLWCCLPPIHESNSREEAAA